MASGTDLLISNLIACKSKCKMIITGSGLGSAEYETPSNLSLGNLLNVGLMIISCSKLGMGLFQHILLGTITKFMRTRVNKHFLYRIFLLAAF